MQGNRATQTSGLAEASRFLYIRGIDGGDGLFLLLQLFTRPFPFLSPHLQFPNFPFPHHNSVSTAPRNRVPLVSLLICLTCVLSVTL